MSLEILRILRLTGIEVPETDVTAISPALANDDLPTLIRYAYLYPWLRHIYPSKAYSEALILESTVPAFQEYVLIKRRQIELHRVYACARRSSDDTLLRYLQEHHPANRLCGRRGASAQV
jgi:hypothetical protein